MKTGSFYTLVLFLLSIMGTTGTAAAPVYSWQDDSGRTHYSDQSPAGDLQVEQTDIDIPTQLDSRTPQQIQADRAAAVRRQIEYYDQQREAQRQAWIERQRLLQTARAQQLRALQLQQQAELASQYTRPVVIHHRPYRYPRHPHAAPSLPAAYQPVTPYGFPIKNKVGQRSLGHALPPAHSISGKNR